MGARALPERPVGSNGLVHGDLGVHRRFVRATQALVRNGVCLRLLVSPRRLAAVRHPVRLERARVRRVRALATLARRAQIPAADAPRLAALAPAGDWSRFAVLASPE